MLRAAKQCQRLSVRESVTKRKRYSFIYLFIFISIDPSSETVILCDKQTFVLDFGIKLKLPCLGIQVYFNVSIFFTLYRLYCFLQVLIALFTFLELHVVPNVSVSFLVCF